MGTRTIKGPRKTVQPEPLADGFSDYLKEWAERNNQKLIIAGVAVLVIMAAAWGTISYRNSIEKSARAEYAQLIGRWPDKDIQDPANPQQVDPQAVPKLIPDLEKFVQSHDGTVIGTNAKLDLARAYMETKRFEDAVQLSRKAMSELPAKSSLRPLVQYQIALSLVSMGKTGEAAAEWNALKGAGVQGIGREALWHLAKQSAAAGDSARALEQYEAAMAAPGNYPSPTLLQFELASLKAKTGGAGAPGEAAPAEPKK